MAIEIESSSDSVEQVQAALSQSIKIDETPAEEEKKPSAPPSPEASAKATDEDAADEPKTDEEEEPKEKAADAPKKAAPTVPLSRLNEEIRKRKALQQQLAERDEKPAVEAADEPAVVPQNFSGEAEPQIDTFMKDVDQFDPAAVNKAIAGFTSAHSLWSRKEARAEVAYQQQLDAAETARLARTKLFREALPDLLKVRPDYDDVVAANKDVQLSPTVSGFMYESKLGPFLLIHLLDNPDVLATVQGQGVAGQVHAMEALAAELATAREGDEEPRDEVGKPKTKTPAALKTVSKAPEPANRLKPAGPGPRTLQELAGTTDRVGVDIEFNPEYERAVKARRARTL